MQTPTFCEPFKIIHHEISTEISEELMTKLEKKARHKNQDLESLVCEAVDAHVEKIIRGSYPSGDKK